MATSNDRVVGMNEFESFIASFKTGGPFLSKNDGEGGQRKASVNLGEQQNFSETYLLCLLKKLTILVVFF